MGERENNYTFLNFVFGLYDFKRSAKQNIHLPNSQYLYNKLSIDYEREISYR